MQGVWTGTHRNRKEGGAQVWAGKQVLSMMGTQKNPLHVFSDTGNQAISLAQQQERFQEGSQDNGEVIIIKNAMGEGV